MLHEPFVMLAGVTVGNFSFWGGDNTIPLQHDSASCICVAAFDEPMHILRRFHSMQTACWSRCCCTMAQAPSVASRMQSTARA